MMRMVMYIVVAVAVVAHGGCSTVTPSEKLTEIRLGMTKTEVRQAMGHPTVARGAIRNKFGQVVEVWEYALALPSTDSAGQIVGKSALTVLTLGIGAAAFKGERRNYWLYFVHDELARWGEAGDWSREPDRIYQINFEPQITAPR